LASKKGGGSLTCARREQEIRKERERGCGRWAGEILCTGEGVGLVVENEAQGPQRKKGRDSPTKNKGGGGSGRGSVIYWAEKGTPGDRGQSVWKGRFRNPSHCRGEPGLLTWEAANLKGVLRGVVE